VTAFAGRWLRLGEPGVGDDLVADGAPTLVSDFLLQRDGGDGVRCVAYLPRTTVLDHVDRGAARERPSTPRRRAAVGTLGP
jgi:hypothetical protein